MTRKRGRGPGFRWIALIVMSLLALLVSPATAQATSYVPIDGQGSTWDENAISQWTADVHKYGMDVQFTGNGSSAGRTAFRGGLVDYAASDIPYGETDDGQTDPPPPQGSYAYIPIVAGGTAFMYHLTVAGRQVTNLRLSGQTLAKIFTGNLTMWNAPEIQAENPGITLPQRQIIPVVRTDGSGSSAQLTKWMSEEFPSMWNAYCKAAQRPVFNPCGSTSFYPTVPGSDFISQSLDAGVAGYVSEPTSDGAITYTEYSYALQANYPVVQMLNSAGYYTLPTASNDAVSLTQAKINNDASNPSTYLTQNLDAVYSDKDPRTYVLSSYSYLIIPLTPTNTFSATKGATLSAFADFALCQGQQAMGPLGYSPLPINLVEAGFSQLKKVPGAVAQNINVAACNNPTFSTSGVNLVVQKAPQPPACAKAGPVQCAPDGVTPIPTGAGGSGGSGSGGAGGASGAGASTGPSGAANPSATASAAAAQVGSLGGGSNGGAGGAGSSLNPNVVAGQVYLSAASESPVGTPLMVLAACFLMMAVFGPVVFWRIRRRRR